MTDDELIKKTVPRTGGGSTMIDPYAAILLEGGDEAGAGCGRIIPPGEEIAARFWIYCRECNRRMTQAFDIYRTGTMPRPVRCGMHFGNRASSIADFEVMDRALTDWREDRAYVDSRGNYHVKHSKSDRSGPIAFWNRLAKLYFPSVADLQEYAERSLGEVSSV